MNDRVNLTQASLMTALAVVVSLATVYVPFLGVLVFIIPVIYAIIATLTGGKHAILSAVASFFIIMFTVDVMYALNLLIISILPGISVGYMINKEKDEEEKSFKPIYFGTISFMISIIVFFIICNLFFKINILGQFTELVEKSIEMQMKIMQSANIGTNENIITEDLVNLMKSIMPAILFFYSIISSSVTYYLETFILRRIKKINYDLPKFTEFYLPGNAVLVSLLLYIVVMVIGALKIPLYTDSIMINLQLVFSMMFLVQGISVGIYFIKDWMKKSPNKIMIIAMALVFLSGSMIISFVGMLDSVMDFRRVRNYKST
ncbi:MAG: YybS family protein [Paraclostridium sp.]